MAVILGTLKAANDYVDHTVSKDAPKCTYNFLQSRFHHVWINNNYELLQATKDRHGVSC